MGLKLPVDSGENVSGAWQDSFSHFRFLKSPFWSPVTSTTSSSKRQRSTTSLPRRCSRPGPRDPKRGPTEASPCRIAGPPKAPPYSENSWAWTFFPHPPQSGCTHYRRVFYTLPPRRAHHPSRLKQWWVTLLSDLNIQITIKQKRKMCQHTPCVLDTVG